MHEIDVTPLKEIQKFIWSQGDYPALAREVIAAPQALVSSCSIGPGQRVLDVAAGHGNVAVAAAGAGAAVTACDITPAMVELGRGRCAEEGVAVDWLEADAEALPFADASFDAALSCFGTMFAPRPEVAAAELFRVVKPGGLVGVANWTERSFPGRILLRMAGHMPEPPVPAPRPLEWGDEDVLRQRLEPHCEGLRIERRSLCMWHDSAEAMWEFQQRVNGPLLAARMLLADRYDAFAEEALREIEAIGEHRGGRFVVESEYLVATARPVPGIRVSSSPAPTLAAAPAGPPARERT